MKLVWNPDATPLELHSILETLAEEYPIAAGKEQPNLVFELTENAPDHLKVSFRDGVWHITAGTPSIAGRGIAHALAGKECDEKIFFKTLGILLDCTRGNVITVERFKAWLRRLAMMGYNMAMIYVKDAYQLPGEPYFGYMRGAYSLGEMKEVDAYARKLHIEMIASIQALGHVEPVLRWEAYDNVKDTADVLLVDEPETYKLLKKIIGFWSEALSSRRIHLGMDETKSLGRGRFMDKHGYENPFFIYNRHLKEVCAICEEYRLEPIIWSDMYFRFANSELDYYDTASPIPEEVKKGIPDTVQLSYWDYYHRDPDFYVTMLDRNRELNGKTPLMASGIWTWYRNWCDYEYTFNTVRACVDGCRRTGTNELILTLWGDDGGYCEFNSALAGLAWTADLAHSGAEDEKRTAELFQAVCGTSYQLQLLCGDFTRTGVCGDGSYEKVSSASMLWDDPIMGIVWNELPGTKLQEPVKNMLADYYRILEATAGHREDHSAGDLNYAWCLANLLIRKIELRQDLLKAYETRDMAALDHIVQNSIPGVIEAIEGFGDAFRAQWFRSFKSYGLELMQIRFGGLIERYHELERLLEEMLDGEISSIPELEVKHQPIGKVPRHYVRCATGCFFV